MKLLSSISLGASQVEELVAHLFEENERKSPTLLAILL